MDQDEMLIDGVKQNQIVILCVNHASKNFCKYNRNL